MRALSRFLSIWSHTISILFYPMWMPTYGVLLYTHELSQNSAIAQMMQTYISVLIGGTVILTILIPLLMLGLLVASGHIDNILLDRPEQRTLPYLYTAVCYGLWCYLLRAKLFVTGYLLWIALGALLALFIVAVINRWWKISAHATGIGGLTGGVWAFYWATGTLDSVVPVTVLLLCSLLVMYARLYLNKHNPAQVVAGLLLGLLSTFIPCWISTLF